MCDELRNKTSTKIDEETKESLIKEGKSKAVEEYQNMLAAALTRQADPYTRSTTKR